MEKILKDLIEICDERNETITDFTSHNWENGLPRARVEDYESNTSYILEFDKEWYIL